LSDSRAVNAATARPRARLRGVHRDSQRPAAHTDRGQPTHRSPRTRIASREILLSIRVVH